MLFKMRFSMLFVGFIILSTSYYLYSKICFPGAVCSTITIRNASSRPIIAIATRRGCLGAEEGEAITCNKVSVEPGQFAPMEIRYPYEAGYKIIVHQMDAQNRQMRFESTRDAADRESFRFPHDFSWDVPNFWISPNPKLRLNQACFVGTHNSHANFEDGYAYNQQLWSLERQLNNGVRQLLLDYYDEDGVAKMCHGACKTVSLGLRLGSPNKTVKSGLETIKNFLDNNRGEIVTLELENYLDGNRTYQEIKSVPGLENYVLKHADYEPMNNNGQWPTLEWLINKNKRLIIFDTQDNQQYAYDTNVYLTRNMYGTLSVDDACKLRGDPRPNRRLWQLNYFGTVATVVTQDNSYNKLMTLYVTCKSRGFVNDSPLPNFLALDFVQLGEAFKFANWINSQSAKGNGLSPIP